jgi:hypothetical protein
MLILDLGAGHGEGAWTLMPQVMAKVMLRMMLRMMLRVMLKQAWSDAKCTLDASGTGARFCDG